MLNDSSSAKDDVNPDQFFLPSLADQPNEFRQQAAQPVIREAKTKVPIIIQGSMPDENLLTFQKLQAYFQQQQQIINSQDALANHYLNISSVIKQIQSQQSLQQEPEPPQYMAPQTQQKSSKQNKSLVRNASASNFKQLANIQEIKGNVKNAYIKKITSLLNLTQEDKEEESSSEMSQDYKQRNFYKNLKSKGILGSTVDLVNMEEKNVKMKESAKNSRLRKKVYINMLESKVDEFQEKITKYHNGTIQAMKYLESCLQRCEPLSSLVVGQVQLQNQIKQSVEKEANIEEQMLMQDSFQMRFGTFGVKRKAYIKYCYANLGRLLLQSNYGTLLFGQGEKPKTRSDEFNDYVREFKQVTCVQDDNQTYRILGVINQVLDHRQRQESLIKQLTKEFNTLRRHQSNLDDTVNSIVQVLTPTQQIQFLDEVSNLKIENNVRPQPQSIVNRVPFNPFDADEEDFLDLEGKKKICF